MKITTLDELFLHELRDLYDAEHQIVEALPRMAKAATNPDLKAAFENHLAETRKQVTRLKEVFTECGETPERETCKGMKGLIAEGGKIMDEAEAPDILDAGLIAAAQKIEHYEIATYGTLIAWSETAGFTSVRLLLQQSLEEEKAADAKLTETSESTVNSVVREEEEAEENEEAESTVRMPSRSTAKSRAGQTTPARTQRARK